VIVKVASSVFDCGSAPFRSLSLRALLAFLSLATTRLHGKSICILWGLQIDLNFPQKYGGGISERASSKLF
jgi:hypothetical protein